MRSRLNLYMKRLVAFTAVALIGLFTTPVVQATCSQANLKGAYAVAGQGTLVASLPGIPAPAPWAESSLANFDGAGSFSGKGTVNIGGVVLNITFTGTYTVNSDCTGDVTINTNLGLTVHHAIVVIGGGQRFIETETDPLAVVQYRVEKLED
jgi:hypothetical protein